MVLLGAVVTDTGSGQGCGNSWPFCHGQLVPDTMSISAALEYSHRIASGADSFLVFTLTVWAWLLYRRDTRVKILSFLSLFFIVLQAILGAVTVVYEGTFAKYPLLALHFGFALISFASVLLLTVHLFGISKNGQYTPKPTYPMARWLRYSIWGLTAYTYLVVYTGALVQHTEAALGCGQQFPTCNTYLPDFHTPAGVQMLHRYSAASIWFLLLIFMVVVIKKNAGRRDVLQASILAFVFVTLQALSGIGTVLSGAQAGWGLLHTTLITFLFSILSYLCMQIGWPWSNRAQAPQKSPVLTAKPKPELQQEYV